MSFSDVLHVSNLQSIHIVQPCRSISSSSNSPTNGPIKHTAAALVCLHVGASHGRQRLQNMPFEHVQRECTVHWREHLPAVLYGVTSPRGPPPWRGAPRQIPRTSGLLLLCAARRAEHDSSWVKMFVALGSSLDGRYRGESHVVTYPRKVTTKHIYSTITEK